MLLPDVHDTPCLRHAQWRLLGVHLTVTTDDNTMPCAPKFIGDDALKQTLVRVHVPVLSAYCHHTIANEAMHVAPCAANRWFPIAPGIAHKMEY